MNSRWKIVASILCALIFVVSCTTKREVAVAPKNTGSPVILGTATVQSVLRASNGAWLGTPYPSLSFQWNRVDLNNNIIPIADSNSATYTISDADKDSRLFVTITGTNVAGQAQATSTHVGPVFVGPINVHVPIISADALGFTVGAVLTVSDGVWGPVGAIPTISGVRWQGDGIDIAGATNKTHTLVKEDAGKKITAIVQATNSGGSVEASSEPTVIITMTPVNKVVPTISGTLQVGGELSAEPGIWEGFPTPAFSYEWFRSGNSSAVGSSKTYTSTIEDAGQQLYVRVSASNSQGNWIGGPVSANSVLTAAIRNEVQNAQMPTIVGEIKVGSTITANTGTWTGYPVPSISYSWSIAGSTIGSENAAYTIKAADAGKVIRLTVQASNSASPSGVSVYVESGEVKQDIANVGVPNISGEARVGQNITGTSGIWEGYPAPELRYQWSRVDGTTVVEIAGATGAIYSIVDADVGYTLRLIVTGSNVDNTEGIKASSADSDIVAGIHVANSLQLPEITGITTAGQTLTANPGTWTGSPAPTFTYQWKRGGTNIDGAVLQTYTLQADDIENQISVAVTATNSQGLWPGVPVTVTTDPTPVIVGQDPVNIALPVITGLPQFLQTLTVSKGSWLGIPEPTTFTYQWQRIDKFGAITNVGSGSTSYKILAAGDVGKTLQVIVRAQSQKGSWISTVVSATSDQTAVITNPPFYHVIYNGNGQTSGTVPVDVKDYYTGSNYTVAANTGNLTKTGYQFVGWNTSADGTGTTYSVGSVVAMGTADVTLYAKWSLIVTITFSLNGGSGTAPTNVVTAAGARIYLPGVGAMIGPTATPTFGNAWISGGTTYYTWNEFIVPETTPINMSAVWN